jgi:DNA-directed RNA polymerase specialized sigma24 family protein
VGYLMREAHGMTNPEDIDDCMQAGYFKVWQQLQQNPDYFAAKPKRYIVQAIVFRSKAQRYSHLRHYHKLVYDADATTQRSAALMTTDQVDTWIDLEQALGRVARQIEDTPALLLGLYCLITQVTVQDVADTFGMGYSTLMKKRNLVRADLAAALPGYGPKPQNGESEVVSPTLSTPAPATGLVTARLLEAVHDPLERVIYPSAARPADKQSGAVNGVKLRTSLGIANGQSRPPPLTELTAYG